MNIRNTLYALLAYYDKSRTVGHTDAMLHGAANHPKAVVVVGHNSMADYIQSRSAGMIEPARIVPMSSLENYLFARTPMPLAFDNSALWLLFTEALREIDALRAQLRDEGRPHIAVSSLGDVTGPYLRLPLSALQTAAIESSAPGAAIESSAEIPGFVGCSVYRISYRLCNRPGIHDTVKPGKVAEIHGQSVQVTNVVHESRDDLMQMESIIVIGKPVEKPVAGAGAAGGEANG